MGSGKIIFFSVKLRASITEPINLTENYTYLQIYYRSSMYNIPVALWILDTHPIHAPLCYVRPTPDMQIKAWTSIESGQSSQGI